MRLLTKKRLVKSSVLALGALLLVLLIGCESTVYAPRDPVDPVNVYLLQDDRHLGLILPRAQGGFVEYGFGDWDWYAEQKDSWYNVFDTVLWPTQGTLARRIVLAADEAALRRRFSWMEIDAIAVARQGMWALRDQLDRQYRQHADLEKLNANTGMLHVPHDDSYWFMYTCSDALAGWLRQLGCEVSWVPVRVDLAVDREG